MRILTENSAGFGHFAAAAAMLVCAGALSAAELSSQDLPKGIGLLGAPAANDCPIRGGDSTSLRPGCKPADTYQSKLSALLFAQPD